MRLKSQALFVRHFHLNQSDDHDEETVAYEEEIQNPREGVFENQFFTWKQLITAYRHIRINNCLSIWRTDTHICHTAIDER